MRAALRARACLLLAAALVPASPSLAARLFTFAAATAPAMDHLGSVRPLAVDRAVLADLRTSQAARLDAFPLGADGTAVVDLARIAPFPADARVEAMGPDGPRALALPDAVYFAGSVAGDPTSHVLLVAGVSRVRGFVATAGDVYPFGPDAGGRHRSYSLRGADPARYPRPSAYCLNEREAEVVARPRALAPHALPPVATPPAAPTGTLRVADVAVETDNELRAKFASDQDALDYLSTLLAAATAIYERDLGVRVQFSYLRLWSPGVDDPWTASDTLNALYDVQDYWNTPENGMAAAAGAFDLVHFVSGKPVQGGIAYVDVLCDGYWGFGVSQVYGAFDLSDPNGIWDVEVFTHELGHNFGSPHSHCYQPPLDHCYASESGCYAGVAEESRGTLMSYCHLWSHGLANIDLAFGPTISARIGESVAAASCLGTVSGSTTSTTAPPPSTTTTTPVASTTSSTSAPSTSTSLPTTTTTSTTSSTLPPDGDADGDAVADGADGCADTPAGDLVDAAGCSVCPCAGPREGGAWRSRSAYLRCVRAEMRRRSVLHRTDRLALRQLRRASSCGRRGYTRCCLPDAARGGTACRVVRVVACGVQPGAGDVGPGTCRPSFCAP